MRLITIGVYGADEAAFFGALQLVGVDTFCDIRWRRGMRGKEYAFVNSKRLQKRLTELGIRYLHMRDLAPEPELRKAQDKPDKAEGTAKRKRTVLGEVFVQGYRRSRLADFDSRKFIEQFGTDA